MPPFGVVSYSGIGLALIEQVLVLTWRVDECHVGRKLVRTIITCLRIAIQQVFGQKKPPHAAVGSGVVHKNLIVKTTTSNDRIFLLTDPRF